MDEGKSLAATGGWIGDSARCATACPAAGSAQVVTSSDFSNDFGGEKAIDGVVSQASKWASDGSSLPQWLALDLGEDLTVNGFIVRHAGDAGEFTSYNTKHFAIQSASSLSGPWTNETVVDNSGQANVTSRSYVTPKVLRHVRLHITDAGIDDYTRIPEFEVWGEEPAGDDMTDDVPSGVNLALASAQVVTSSDFSNDFGGEKAIDGVVSQASKWASDGSSLPQWLALDLGEDLTVNGYIVRHAGDAGEFTSYNTKHFAIQSASSLSGPWTNETVVDNSGQANVTSRSYVTPKVLRHVRLHITDAGIDDYTRIPEFEVWGEEPAAPTTVEEDFETMPSWSSTFDASWGSAASWSIVSGGESGNALQTSRSSGGSSARVLVRDLDPDTNYTIAVYMRSPSSSDTYWAEVAYKLGSHTAGNFDQDGGSWTMVQKFANDGTNGNGNTWTEYWTTFNSGSSTQISVGFKLGSSGGTGPVVQWDTLRVE